MIKYVKGDLIQLALQGKFDVIVHGCNCFCTMGAGIAKQMNQYFQTNEPDFFKMESEYYCGDINKLGCIDWISAKKVNLGCRFINLIIVNAYTQYNLGKSLNYNALELCMKKINHTFKGKHIGLPQIGCGIAGGNWKKVEEIINKTLTDCTCTVVIYQK